MKVTDKNWIIKCPKCGSEQMSYFIPTKDELYMVPTGPGYSECRSCGWNNKSADKGT